VNRKSYLLVVIACGFLLAAIYMRRGEFLLLAIPFLSYLATGVIQAPGELRLRASRSIDRPSVSANQAVEMRILVENQGHALVNLFLDDALQAGMTLLEGVSHQRVSLAAGQAVEWSCRFKAARGLYSWENVYARASDPLGIWDLEQDVPAPGNMIAHPAPLSLHPSPLKPRQTLHTAGQLASRLAGSGTDFWGVREYLPGDTLQRINWRLAARYPRKIFSNEFERQEIADYGFILDARQLSGDGALDAAMFEHSVSAVSSLSENFLRAGNRVSLLVFGRSIHFEFPGYGKKQHHALLRRLARAKLGSNIAFKKLEYFPVRLFPTHSLIVVLSSVDADDLETYARLMAYGYEVLLISPDAVDYANRIAPQSVQNTLAFRAAKVERALMLKKLLNMGIKVIDWQVDTPLGVVMQQNARQFMHRRSVG
jgi:uncharacterized protein (DUF58 family)